MTDMVSGRRLRRRRRRRLLLEKLLQLSQVLVKLLLLLLLLLVVDVWVEHHCKCNTEIFRWFTVRCQKRLDWCKRP